MTTTITPAQMNPVSFTTFLIKTPYGHAALHMHVIQITSIARQTNWYHIDLQDVSVGNSRIMRKTTFCSFSGLSTSGRMLTSSYLTIVTLWYKRTRRRWEKLVTSATLTNNPLLAFGRSLRCTIGMIRIFILELHSVRKNSTSNILPIHNMRVYFFTGQGKQNV